MANEGTGGYIQNCFVDADPPLSALPISLRVYFNPTQKSAVFRLRATSERKTALSCCLNISPTEIHRISLSTGPPAYLHFHVAAIDFIAPKGPLVEPTSEADFDKVKRLRSLTQQTTLRISLPDNWGDYLPQLAALCSAVGEGGFRPDPKNSDLNTLFAGQGGRVVHADELWTPSSSSDLPPADLFARCAQPPASTSNACGLAAATDSTAPNEPPPPLYLTSSPPPPLSPRPSRSTNRKRIRTRTPSSSSSSPDYRVWKHLDLVVGEREKIMAELLRRADKREHALQKVMNNLDMKCARAEEVTARLTALIPWVEEREAVLRGEGGGLQSAQEPEETPASQISTASASPSASPQSVASISSNISDRVQAYITQQFDNLRDEFASNYVTHEVMEEFMSEHVAEYEMLEVIREAIDEAMGDLRERMSRALEY